MPKQKKKNIDIVLATHLVRTSQRANPIQICYVIFRYLYDCEM